MKNGKKRYKLLWGLLGLLFLFAGFVVISYRRDIRAAYDRLERYDVKMITTEFGNVTYLDEGNGEAVLIAHGIFGGYDQGLASLSGVVGDSARKISVSRFGYLGSDLPADGSPANQAAAYKAVLDELQIDRAFILMTSAGGSAGFQFALRYPERVKGLILLTSAVPWKARSREEITGMMGPPSLILNDFPMWLSMKYFGFVFKSMFNSEVDSGIYNTMLPVSPRKAGIENDTNVINVDMDIHYDDYPVEQINVPMIVIHAKDDPMVKFETVQVFIDRVHPETVIFETGGHLISGQGDAVGIAVQGFIERNQ